MERTSTKHSARTDDAMQHETESLTRGAPVEARSEESRMAEPPGDGEYLASSVLHETSEPIMGMPLDEIAARSEFAIALRPGAFPADGPTLLRVADEDDAPEWVRETLRRVDQVQLYENVQQVWQAAGGHREMRTLPHDEPERAAASDVAAEPPVRKSRSRARAAAPASEATTAPASKARRADAPAVTSTVGAPARDESYLGAVAEYGRASWNLTQRTIRLALWPIRRLRRH